MSGRTKNTYFNKTELKQKNYVYKKKFKIFMQSDNIVREAGAKC